MSAAVNYVVTDEQGRSLTWAAKSAAGAEAWHLNFHPDATGLVTRPQSDEEQAAAQAKLLEARNWAGSDEQGRSWLFYAAGGESGARLAYLERFKDATGVKVRHASISETSEADRVERVLNNGRSSL